METTETFSTRGCNEMVGGTFEGGMSPTSVRSLACTLLVDGSVPKAKSPWNHVVHERFHQM